MTMDGTRQTLGRRLATAGFMMSAVVFSAAMLPVGFAAAQDEPATAAVTQDFPKAEELFEKHLEAVGGREKLDSVKSSQIKGSFSMPSQGMNGELNITAQKPNHFVLMINLPGVGEIKQGYNGKVGWEMNPISGPRILQGKELEQFKLQADFNSDLNYKKHYPEMETVDKLQFGDYMCYKVHTKNAAEIEADLFFDVESGLLVGMEATTATQMGDMKSRTEMKEYKEFGGIKQATKTVITMIGMGNLEQILAIDSITYGEVDESVFALPDQIKTILENMPADEEEGEEEGDEDGGGAGG